MRYSPLSTTVLALGFATLATGATAQERLTASAGFPGPAILTDNDYTKFTAAVEEATGGDLTFDLHVGGALLPLATTLEGLRDGLADVGNVVSAYIPSSMPKNNVVADVGLVLEDHMAASFAITEMNLLNEVLQEEWQSFDVVFGGGFSTPPYLMLCVPEIRTLADVEGKKMRTASGSHVDLVNLMKGEPVSVSFNDAYTGLERGSLDCILGSAENLGTGFKLWDVIGSVTMIPLGTHISGGAWIYNKSTWGGLTDLQRKSLLEQMAVAGVRRQMAYDVEIGQSLEGSWERGVERIEPDETLSNMVDEYKATFIANLPGESESKRNVPAAEAKALIDDFQQIYGRWQGLLEGVDRTDEAALVALVQAEIYDKINPAEYGL